MTWTTPTTRTNGQVPLAVWNDHIVGNLLHLHAGLSAVAADWSLTAPVFRTTPILLAEDQLMSSTYVWNVAADAINDLRASVVYLEAEIVLTPAVFPAAPTRRTRGEVPPAVYNDELIDNLLALKVELDALEARPLFPLRDLQVRATYSISGVSTPVTHAAALTRVVGDRLIAMGTTTQTGATFDADWSSLYAANIANTSPDTSTQRRNVHTRQATNNATDNWGWPTTSSAQTWTSTIVGFDDAVFTTLTLPTVPFATNPETANRPIPRPTAPAAGYQVLVVVDSELYSAAPPSDWKLAGTAFYDYLSSPTNEARVRVWFRWIPSAGLVPASSMVGTAGGIGFYGAIISSFFLSA